MSEERKKVMQRDVSSIVMVDGKRGNDFNERIQEEQKSNGAPLKIEQKEDEEKEKEKEKETAAEKKHLCCFVEGLGFTAAQEAIFGEQDDVETCAKNRICRLG